MHPLDFSSFSSIYIASIQINLHQVEVARIPWSDSRHGSSSNWLGNLFTYLVCFSVYAAFSNVQAASLKPVNNGVSGIYNVQCPLMTHNHTSQRLTTQSNVFRDSYDKQKSAQDLPMLGPRVDCFFIQEEVIFLEFKL